MRYAALSHINPLNVLPGSTSALFPLAFSVYEIAFWQHRVSEVNIAGTIHSGSNIFTVNFNAQMLNDGTAMNCVDEVDSYLNGAFDIAHTQTITTPPDFCTVEFFFGLAYVHNADQWFPNLVFSTATGAGEASSVETGFPAATMGAKMLGTDLLFGQTYERHIPLFGPGPIGDIVISPNRFWDYGGRYDVNTGARV